MNKKKIILILASVAAIGGIGYFVYKAYKKAQTSSNDPEKNNRNVIQELVNI